ncbi:RloB family protein [Nonomuraea rhizosphaerae]|uniref:RloB family protein n=1 Tax=Nonomuraea rhizosphaerae TaxID=2665663 RepID=UPI001C603D92|nr:RloB family protein [Nonomuraea rhizosphaerae]
MSGVRRKGPPTGGPRVPRVVTEGRKRKVIYAVVEGESTERDYLGHLEERFGGDPRRFEIHVLWKRKGLKPDEVVNWALEKASELEDPRREQVWALFDRDDHSRVEESCRRAERAGVRVAFSHPCFELWLLLHFVAGVPGAPTSKCIQDRLRAAHQAFRTFDKRLDGAPLAALNGNEADAVNRARSLVTNCPSMACTARNGHGADCRVLDRTPSTDVWRILVELGIVTV